MLESGLSTNFRGYLCRMVGYSSLLGFRLPFIPTFLGLPINPSTFWCIICTENLHPLDLDIDGTDSLEKTLNCFNPCFPGYLCRMVGYRRPITTFEIWHFGKLEFSNFWIFEFLNFWTFELLNFWIFEILNFWIFEFLNFWIFEFLNFWIFEFLNFRILEF